jgi:signal transduction histidine kinase/DNA-binding response OmpR family regulator
MGSLPVVILASYLIGNSHGMLFFYINIIFMLFMIAPLIIFHFYKNKIENYAFFTQISIVLLTSIKVYIMGGIMFIGTPVYIGFIAPIYALTLPNRKRAIFIFFLFIACMITATLLNPYESSDALFAKYILGFVISISIIFLTLFYYTTQLDKAKRKEKKRVQELDDLKTKFFTHIAHEFRTPLSVIIGMADQMIKDPKNWLDEAHDTINRNATNLVKLSNKLLELSKLEANAMPINLIQDDIKIFLHYLIESFHSLTQSKKIKLEFICDSDEIIMDFDPDKIQDIISNLLFNAIKFTPKGGSIKISVNTGIIDTNKYLVLKIQDTGIGIPSDQIDNIFNRYYQAKNHMEALEEGTGIGLALTREFVKLLGGDISVVSEIGKGSTFTIQLPITNKAKETHLTFNQKGKKEVKPNFKSFQKPNSLQEDQLLNLLIVEDNNDVIRYLNSLLLNHYNITVANNGKDGYELALKIIPDLIISDVMMPYLDGFALCNKLKDDIRTSHIPLIMLTALADQKSKIEGISAGADAYLSKPFNPDELFVRIDKLISLRKKMQNHFRNVINTEHEINTIEPVDQNKEDSFIKKVRLILESNIADEEFGISQLCNILAMSRSQLYRKFSSLTDLTVHQYIMTLKLKKAKDLLLTTNLNVSEVAYDTGFKNISHFSRVFTKEFGYNPSNFKMEDQV